MKGNDLLFVKIKNWFHNYWYYYKWRVIILGAFLLIGAICIGQCSSKENNDVSILYTGPHLFEMGEKNSITSSFKQLMDRDYNNDGKKVIDFIDLSAFSDDQIKAEIGEDPDEQTVLKYAQYTNAAVQSNFAQIASKGDVSICLLDEYWYKILLDAGHLLDLETALGFKPDCLIDEYSAYLSDLPVYSYFSETIGKLPPDTIICFRKMSVTSAITGKKQAEQMYAYSRELLLAIFEFGNS